MVAPTKPKPDVAKAEAAIAKLALAYPDVTEENPWGHRAFKVRKKTFLFLGSDAEGVSFSVKLPHSGAQALALEGTEPTHYGLGKAGWVTARFARGGDVPLPLVAEWLTESYDAIAPARKAKGGAKKPVTRAKATAKPPARTKRSVKAKARAPAKRPAKTRSRRA